MSSILYQILRSQAWERAKGELRSMYTTYHGSDSTERFKAMKSATEAFIKNVEDEGLQE